MSTRRALLVDFGGVLTTDVLAVFNDFCRAEGLAEDRFVDLLRADAEAQRLLVAVETGALDEAAFERAFAPLLGEHVVADRLLRRLTATLEPDPPMIGAVAELRDAGVTCVLLSNSLGMHAYEGLDVERLFDHVVISGEVGMRKPSRAIYEHALELAGAPAAEAAFVDDFEHNVVAARRLGLEAVLHTDARTTIPALAELFAVDLAVPA